ncbi:MAG: GerMN domain-containing protein, partial [Lachnospiraceae bacterium]|nr:GerMN domain-containing protein [Lachnospiraceae bacterium]
LRHYFYENGLVTLNFDASYASLDRITEILDRAAIVRTLMQIPGVDAVSFLVDGKPLKDAAGAVVGNMNADTFIYNAGKEINNYDKGRILLYFTNQEGNKLVPIYRTVIYSSNVSMEQVIAEELVKGPASDISRPTINPDTKVLNVTLQDGICYVDFNEKFLSEPYQVKPDIVIYSIVNSLAELTEVNKVQISVNGSTADKFMDSIPLSTLFERKLDME